MRGGRLQPGSIMKWLAVGLAASPTKGWGRRRELGSLPMKVAYGMGKVFDDPAGLGISDR